MKSVFIVTEDWRRNFGESGSAVSVFSTFEKALKYYENLKEQYNKDYDTLEKLENKEVNICEDINKDKRFAEIEVIFEYNEDYYNICIEEKIIDKE